MTITTESKQEKRVKPENMHLLPPPPSFFQQNSTVMNFSSSLHSTAVQLTGGNPGTSHITSHDVCKSLPTMEFAIKYQAGENEVDGRKCNSLLCCVD